MTQQRFFGKARPVAGLILAAPVGLACHATPTFTDVTGVAGIDHVQWDAPADLPDQEAYFMTGGAAAADFDGDGWVDLFFTRLGAPDVLYRNRGDGTFEDVSLASGFTAPLRSSGAAVGDLDNDGDADLYLTTVDDDSRRYHLYINNGAGVFTEQALPRGAAVASDKRHFGYGTALGDYDRDGYLDLYTAEWGAVELSTPGARSHTRLLRNLGAAAPGHFEDVTLAAGASVDDTVAQVGNRMMLSTFAFSPRFADLDDDGHPDLAIASDFGTSRLLWNNGDGTFTDGTDAAGVGTDENGMGAAIGDFNGDGRLDWFVSSIYDPQDTCGQSGLCFWSNSGNRLYQNQGGRTFTDATDAAGVRDGGWGWGSDFFDYDNDGDLDLAHTNGIDLPSGSVDDSPFHTDPTRLWRNDAGVFTEVGPLVGVADNGQGRGLLTLDFDRDGDLDLVVVNHAGQPILYRNDGGDENGFLLLELEGTASNRDGFGARVTVIPDLADPDARLVRELSGGTNFLAQSEALVHFGLGDAASADLLQINWPSGVVQRLFGVAANTRLHVTEAAGGGLAGDLDGDGFVGSSDIDLLLGMWNRAVTPGLLGDVNADGVVGAGDLDVLLSAWNAGSAESAAVPEPGTLALGVVGAGLLGRARRRRA